MDNRKKHMVIIGAGPSGLFAARALKTQGNDVTILEKESQVGGKCSTYSDPVNPEVKTEWGAVLLAPNYGVVLDAVEEKQIQFEESVKVSRGSVEILQKMDEMSWYERATFAVSLAMQTAKYTYAVCEYQYARNHLQELPEDFELPFAQFVKKYGIEDVGILLKHLVSGFGYGAMEDVPAYSVMEYSGVGTIPSLLLETVLNKGALVGVKGGTQHLMERIAEDFNVIVSANVMTVDRSSESVKVIYSVKGVSHRIDADGLVLAVSPLQWKKLGMELTDVEGECVDNLSYYRYPVSVCKVKGLAPEHQFIPDALNKKGFGHLSLITTRDNRQLNEDGRLCTAYFNLPPGANDFSLDEASDGYQILKNELSHLDGVRGVNVIDTKIWEDYMPVLPWKLRLKLEEQQMQEDTKTLYVGAYPAGGFEDIRCVADQATRAVKRHIQKDETEEGLVSYAYKELGRAFHFFQSVPRLPPVGDATIAKVQSVR